MTRVMSSREAFESWLNESGAFTDWSRDKTSEANEYHKPLVERTWRAWQAACAYQAALEGTKPDLRCPQEPAADAALPRC